MNKILFCGFGRIGLTHYIISKAVLPDSSFTIFEPNKIVSRILSKYLKNTRVVTDISLLSETNFDYTLICAPTQYHIPLISSATARGDAYIFVEKPFGCHTDKQTVLPDNLTIGYVLRYNPYVQWIRNNIKHNDIIRVAASYNSFTIKSIPKGWRAHFGGGVLNEMGSHIIDLLQFTNVIQSDSVSIDSAKIYSPVSGQDDIVQANMTSGSIDIDIEMNWINESLRKPYFKLEYFLKDGSIVHLDSQSIDIERAGDVTNISVKHFITEIPYYLRGIDFTLQMTDFYTNRVHSCTANEAITVNTIIKMIREAAE
jgi:predicted dehydrogenase